MSISSKRIIRVIGIFILFGITACQNINPTLEEPKSNRITLERCHLSAPGSPMRISAQCGKYSVFEDRSAQSGRQIELNLAIIPAVSRNPSPDPLFFIAGGPGEAATESFLVVYAALIRINQKRDIVLLDQRGTGGSNPLTCSEADDGTYDVNDNSAKTFVEECISNLNGDPRLYTTSIAMDDLDEVRQALGYEQINLYGASYGTRAALVYARQHRENLRSMILDGVVPLDWTLGPSAAGDAQHALDMIFNRCEQEPACRNAFPNLPSEFTTIVKRLQDEPVKVKLNDPINNVEAEHTLTYEAFTNTIHTMSYAPETAALLPLMIHQAYQFDNYRPLVAQYLAMNNLLASQLSIGMRFSILCSEDVRFYGEETFSKGYLGDQFQDSFKTFCKFWPAGNTPSDLKTPLHSDIPTLLLSGEADPITPPENGEQAAKTLTNSLHIIAPGQGHIVIFRGCIPQIGSDFIESASIDSLDTTCVHNITPLPFFINFNGPTP